VSPVPPAPISAQPLQPPPRGLTLSWENIAAIAAVVVGLLVLFGAILFVVARRYTRFMAERVRAAHDDQGSFIKMNAVDSDYDDGDDGDGAAAAAAKDPASIMLDDDEAPEGDGESTDGDASNSEPFYRDRTPNKSMSLIPLDSGTHS
jgi:hypothetical protein